MSRPGGGNEPGAPHSVPGCPDDTHRASGVSLANLGEAAMLAPHPCCRFFPQGEAMDAQETITLTKEDLQQIIELFTHDTEDELPDSYTIYRYDEQPE
jgi:hypothetical protein